MNKYKLLIIICFFLVTLCLPRVTATVKNLNLLGKVIILDAGHGGKDEGASSGPIKESKLNLILTKKLEKELISRGATVYLTRKDNNDLSTTTINRKRNDWIWCWTKSRIRFPISRFILTSRRTALMILWMMNGLLKLRARPEF